MYKRHLSEKSMYRVPYYNFEVNMGTACDMRCSFCFEKENGYKNTSISKESINYFVEYIKYIKKTTNMGSNISIFGGEPFLYIDKLIYLIETVSPYMGQVNIISNGLNIHKYLNELIYIRKIVKNLNISISYNFTLQDSTRQANTYIPIRNNIKLLYNNNFLVRCNTVFTPSTICDIGKVCDDFILLREEVPSCRLIWNYYKDDNSIDTIDFDLLKNELLRVQSKIYSLIYDYNDSFKYNLIGAFRGDHRVDCLFCNVLASLAPDNSIYPGYDVLYSNKFTKDLLRYGNVGDDFSVLDNKRKELLKILPVNPPRQCKKCASQCRVIPWRTMVDDISQYNQMPHSERCQVINFIGKFIPIGYESY